MNWFSTVKVTPTASAPTVTEEPKRQAVSTRIKLKNSHMINVMHVNGPPQSSSASTRSNAGSNNVTLNDSYLNDSTTTTTNVADASVTVNTVKSTATAATTATLSELLNSSEFKLSRTTDDIVVKDGRHTVGYSIACKAATQVRLANRLVVNNNNSVTADDAITMAAMQQMTIGKVKPLLFFIHGVGGNVNIWHNQIEHFARLDYEIVAIDLVGHGESNVLNEPYNYQFLEMALDCLLVFDMFARPHAASNVVIGHSYGCSFCTYLADSRRHVIDKLVLISGGSPYPLDYKSSLLKSPLCLIQMLKPAIACHFYKFALHFIDKQFCLWKWLF